MFWAVWISHFESSWPPNTSQVLASWVYSLILPLGSSFLLIVKGKGPEPLPMRHGAFASILHPGSLETLSVGCPLLLIPPTLSSASSHSSCYLLLSPCVLAHSPWSIPPLNFPRTRWERWVWELEHREVATPAAQWCTRLKTTYGHWGTLHRPHKDLSWPSVSAAVPRLPLAGLPPPTSMSSLRTLDTSTCLCFYFILFLELLPDLLDKAFLAHPCFLLNGALENRTS